MSPPSPSPLPLPIPGSEGELILAGTGMEFHRGIKIPEEVIERSVEAGPRGEYAPEYLVEPEHIREGLAEA